MTPALQEPSHPKLPGLTSDFAYAESWSTHGVIVYRVSCRQTRALIHKEKEEACAFRYLVGTVLLWS